MKQETVNTFMFNPTQLRSRLFSSFNFGKIRTYRDMLIHLGYSAGEITYIYDATQLATPCSLSMIRSWFDNYRLSQECAAQAAEFDVIQSYLPTLAHIPYEYPHTSNGEYCSQTQTIERLPLQSSSSLEVLLQDSRKGDRPNKEQETSDNTSESTYTLPVNWKLIHITPYPQQLQAAIELFWGMTEKNYRGQLLRGGVGKGKTIVYGLVIRAIIDSGFLDKLGTDLTLWPIMFVTKNDVGQTKAELVSKFSLDVINEVVVTNIEQMRATFGKQFIKVIDTVEDGIERVEYRWHPNMEPNFLFLNECQTVKNIQSSQSKVFQAKNDSENPHTWVIYGSATPFVRVAEAKCFAVSTRVPFTYGAAVNAPLSNAHWTDFAKTVAYPAEPEEHCVAAISRLMKYLDPYVVELKGIRPQFHAINSTQLIQFRNASERATYDALIENYEKECAKIDKEMPNGRFRMLVEFMILRKGAEKIRAPYIAEFMHECVTLHNQAGVAACCFKDTIATTVKTLIETFGVSRDNISIIWGGIGKKVSVKRTKSETMTEEEEDKFKDVMSGVGYDEAEIQEMLDAEERVDELSKETYPPEWRLGPQSAKERAREIYKFQSGQTHYCLFTFKSGGVGLNLHHSDDVTNFKCRRKKSGYVYEEDIPRVPVRQRAVIMTLVFSVIEQVQGMGRCPRLTSLSDTPQICVGYAGTYEEVVLARVAQKMRCLTAVIRGNYESWQDIIIKQEYKRAEAVRQLEERVDVVDVNGDILNADTESDEQDQSYIDVEEVQAPKQLTL